MNIKVKSAVYILLFVFFAIPFNAFGIGFVTPALALFVGLLYALVLGDVPYGKFNKKCSKYLLQAAVVGLGFGMNFEASLQAGKDGMMLTIASVFLVMIMAVFIGKKMKLDDKTAYLIGSGTAICGGSAIAAVGPVIKADDNQMAVSLGTIFILNAIALFIFPPIGRWLELSDAQFGTWAAIAIHDTSSVVGAGQAFSDSALETATLVKLTRALWIIPLALATTLVYREKSKKITIPWFIFMFVAAMLVNTYAGIPQEVSKYIVLIAKQGMVLTLFLIGSSLSIKVVKNVGIAPVVLGVILWVIIGIVSLFTIMLM